MRFFTIAHAGALAHARVLARALAQHHDGTTLQVLWLDGGRPMEIETEPFQLLSPEEIGVPGWEHLLRDHRWAELKEFFKPHVLSRMIAEGAEAAVYLDVAADVVGPLDRVEAALERHGGVLTPRILGELPSDGRRPSGSDLRSAGRYGAALIGLSRRTMAVEFLAWWAERLTSVARLLAPGAAGTDHWAQRDMTRWIDLAPSIFRDLSVLQDPGTAVSCWNLHERPLECEGGLRTAAGRPLCLFHFEGFDPNRPFVLNAWADRVAVSTAPQLAELCESYSRRLLDAGWRDHRRRSDVGRTLPNGMTFDDRLSYLLAEAAGAGANPGDIFQAKEAEEFMRWLAEPAPYGAYAGINRYLYGVYREREDLRRVYPNIDGSDGDLLAGWAWTFGKHEMAIPDRFMPPRPAGVREGLQSEQDGALPRRQALPRGEPPSLSVGVTGLFTGTLGLGEAARGYVRALEAAQIPVSTSTVDVRQFVSLNASAHEGYAQLEYTDLDTPGPIGFKLICINADELPRFAQSVGEQFFNERPAIGVWAWETDHIPERWRNAYHLLDEIWVYSDYVAGNIGRAAPIPVHRVPPPVVPPDPGDAELDLGVPDGFRFLFMFDFFSTIQRKNPVGLVNAFRLAFETDEGPQLVIKTINGVHRPEALEELLWAARGRPDIHVVDRSLSARERDALLTGCDCYVSLHRSEGFGLTLAECMALGKPVIGTAFSGPTDFMTEENSYPVPYAMTRVGADCEIYPAEGRWADPDVDEAAKLLRRVVERPDEARAKGERARLDIDRLYSPAAIGEQIRSRLEAMASMWGSSATLPPAPSAQAVEAAD